METDIEKYQILLSVNSPNVVITRKKLISYSFKLKTIEKLSVFNLLSIDKVKKELVINLIAYGIIKINYYRKFFAIRNNIQNTKDTL